MYKIYPVPCQGEELYNKFSEVKTVHKVNTKFTYCIGFTNFF